MRVIVCGSRFWNNAGIINRELNALYGEHGVHLTVIEGDARGADAIAGEWADHNMIEHLWFTADWQKYGRAAGPIRNQHMLDTTKPHLVLAFHEDIEHSKGTKDMIKRAKKAGVEVRVFNG